MFINSKIKFNLLFSLLFIITIFSGCSIFDFEDDSPLEKFSIVPDEYYGLPMKGIIVFNDYVKNLEWTSASGLVIFNGKSSLDSIIRDTVFIEYSGIPYIKEKVSSDDSSSLDSVIYRIREKDTITIKFLYNNRWYEYKKEIKLIDFPPSIDSIYIENGNFIKWGNKNYASFLIGSGLGYVNVKVSSYLDDTVVVYWYSKSGLSISKELTNYKSLIFNIPLEELIDTIYIRAINTRGAYTEDSILIDIYKEVGSIWVRDDKGRIYKFTSKGSPLIVWDSIQVEDLEFLDGTNMLYLVDNNVIREYYTDGTLLNTYSFSEHITSLQKVKNTLFVLTYSPDDSLSNIYSLGYEDFDKVFSYKGKLKLLTDLEDFYITVEERLDSNFLLIIRNDTLYRRKAGFLNISKIIGYNGYVYIADYGKNILYSYDIASDSIVGKLYGFGTLVDMDINRLTSELYILDAVYGMMKVKLPIKMNYNVSPLIDNIINVGLDKPSYIIVNEYKDADGEGNIWICDEHNNRVVKLNSSGLLIREIQGYFYFPKKVVINKGIE